MDYYPVNQFVHDLRSKHRDMLILLDDIEERRNIGGLLFSRFHKGGKLRNPPKLKALRAERETVQKEYDELCAERTAYKKEADRLSRLARQKRDSQKTIQRYLQNEQAAKRKKNQLE